VTTEEERLAQFEHGDSIEVPVGRIERELDGLWRQAAQPKPGEKPRPVTRACLWNLIVRSEGEALYRRAKRLVDDISESVPARVLVLRIEAGEPSLRAWVEANWRRAGHVTSGSDEVTLEAHGDAAVRLPALMRMLVISDAPTAMLWLGAPPLDNGRVRGLLGELDRLIFDSRAVADEAALIELQRVAAERPALELADLAWLGVSPLRGLCASLFDPLRDAARLDGLDRVVVASGVVGTQARALLTLGWLASRLGWKRFARQSPAAGGAAGTRRWLAARPDGGQVELVLETRPGGASHGVAELRLEAGQDVWSLVRDRCIDVRAPDLPRRSQPARSHSEPELVVSALGPRGRDPVYRDALAQAALLLEAK
jgi:glucose-6-phosphate dehydrogenase assembly protein OpcA